MIRIMSPSRFSLPLLLPPGLISLASDCEIIRIMSLSTPCQSLLKDIHRIGMIHTENVIPISAHLEASHRYSSSVDSAGEFAR